MISMICVILIVALRASIKVLFFYYENFITLTLMLTCFYLTHFVPLFMVVKCGTADRNALKFKEILVYRIMQF